MMRRDLLLLFALPAALGLGLYFTSLAAGAAPNTASNTGAKTLQRIGNVDVWANQSVITPSAVYYTNPHMVTQSGATLDSDELKGDLDKSGTFTDATATGHVVAHVALATDQTYDLSADKAYYDIAAQQIDLTGKVVKVTATTPYTKGPLVQTGDSAVVLLAKSPKYPQITQFPAILMNNVHTQFTPATERQASSPHANPG